MTFPQFVAQVWRVVRVGGVAALATTLAASQVHGTSQKTLIIAGAVAFVEAVYRQIVPAKEVTQLDNYWAAVKAVGANPVVATELKTLEAKVPAPALSVAEQAIADAGITPVPQGAYPVAPTA